ncbi:unnamed protein product, partial [Rotaria socialis]
FLRFSISPDSTLRDANPICNWHQQFRDSLISTYAQHQMLESVDFFYNKVICLQQIH